MLPRCVTHFLLAVHKDSTYFLRAKQKRTISVNLNLCVTRVRVQTGIESYKFNICMLPSTMS